MIVYLSLICAIFLFELLRKQGGITKKQYCIIIGVMFALVTGLRGVDVGSDTTGYYLGFQGLKGIQTYSQLLATHENDTAYYIYTWLLSRAGGSFCVLTLSVGALFYYAVSKFIYRHSEDACLSYLLLMAFNFFQFSMTGIRQTIAFAFVLLAVCEAYQEKRSLIKMALLCWIGTAFHLSAIISFAMIPIALQKKQASSMWRLAAVLILALGFVLRQELVNSIIDFMADTRFGEYEAENAGGGMTTYLLYLAIYVFGLLFYNAYCDKHKNGKLDYRFMLVGTLLLGLVPVQSVLFRVAWYFSVSLVVFLPRLLNTLMPQDKKLIKPLAYPGVLFMYLFITKGRATALPYTFYWG